ncbi:hypothetical protein [Streptomyces indicus]|uniref:Uncharacterized protein n=1 Tax=Streptomyces indicus TaxID=417292 RepID=A0A1G8WN91_9ACTN|nr:hypothetical protein [Streptomyces indicus]SDJ79110.1 hypothetical protein SAMN05421806_102542 [Streptomyces indicus]
MPDVPGNPGALLLCRSDPAAVGPAAQLLREPMLLAEAGPEWSVLVPEGRPWRQGEEQVDRVARGWASALAVASPWPALALWWDDGGAGFTLASGFRRTVGYVWLANGTPVGEEEALSSFVSRLGLDPVLDMQSLEELARPDSDADARARMRGLLAVLGRAGLALPAGLAPGLSTEELRSAAEELPEVEQVRWTGWREVVSAELDVVERGRLGAWVRGPKARALALVQVLAGVPVLGYALRRRSPAWAVTGVALVVNGGLGLAYDRVRARD